MELPSNSHFSFSRQKKFIKKIHKGHITITETTAFVWELHSLMQPTYVKTLLRCCFICKYTESFVLKAQINFFLGFYAWILEAESILSVHAEECGLTCSCWYLI